MSVIAPRRFDATSSSSQSSWLSIGQHLQFAGKPYASSAMPSRTLTKPATRLHYCTQVHSLLSVLQMPSTQTVITSDQLHRAQPSFSKCSHSALPTIPCFLWTLKKCNIHIQKNPPLVNILSLVNPIQLCPSSVSISSCNLCLGLPLGHMPIGFF
jgi:hypothetical protein